MCGSSPIYISMGKPYLVVSVLCSYFKSSTVILFQYCSSCSPLSQRDLYCDSEYNVTVFTGDCKNFLYFSRLLILSWINMSSNVLDLLDFDDML